MNDHVASYFTFYYFTFLGGAHGKPLTKMWDSPSTSVKPSGGRHEVAFVGTSGFTELSGCSTVFG
jgi:hypothetical protein